MNIKLLNEHNLEFLSLKEGNTGSSEYIHVKMPHCWKSHVAAQICFTLYILSYQCDSLLHMSPYLIWKSIVDIKNMLIFYRFDILALEISILGKRMTSNVIAGVT